MHIGQLPTRMPNYAVHIYEVSATAHLGGFDDQSAVKHLGTADDMRTRVDLGWTQRTFRRTGVYGRRTGNNKTVGSDGLAGKDSKTLLHQELNGRNNRFRPVGTNHSHVLGVVVGGQLPYRPGHLALHT